MGFIGLLGFMGFIGLIGLMGFIGFRGFRAYLQIQKPTILRALPLNPTPKNPTRTPNHASLC